MVGKRYFLVPLQPAMTDISNPRVLYLKGGLFLVIGCIASAILLIEHPSFALPAPEGPRVARVLQQGLAELRLSDQRRGFRAYARNRGLRVREDGSRLHVEGPAFAVTIAFTEQDLVSAMTVHMGSAAG